MTVRDFIQELLLSGASLDDDMLFTDGKKRFFEFNHIGIEHEVRAEDFVTITYPIIHLDEL